MKHVSLLAAFLLLVPVSLRAGEDKKPVLEMKGELTKEDERDTVLTKSYAKMHTVKLEAGKIYRIDLASKKFDAYLRLENSDKKILAKDDDGGGRLNARIIYSVPKDQAGEYRLIVTSFKADGTGEYALSVNEATKFDILKGNVQKIRSLP